MTKDEGGWKDGNTIRWGRRKGGRKKKSRKLRDCRDGKIEEYWRSKSEG